MDKIFDLKFDLQLFDDPVMVDVTISKISGSDVTYELGGETKTTTLSALLDAVQSGGSAGAIKVDASAGSTLRLDKDVTLSGYVFQFDRDITFDLSNHTITCSENTANRCFIDNIGASRTVTVQNGTVVGSNSLKNAGINLFHVGGSDANDTKNGGTLTLSKLTITNGMTGAGDTVCANNGSNLTVNVEDCTINGGERGAIDMNASGGGKTVISGTTSLSRTDSVSTVYGTGDFTFKGPKVPSSAVLR